MKVTNQPRRVNENHRASCMFSPIAEGAGSFSVQIDGNSRRFERIRRALKTNLDDAGRADRLRLLDEAVDEVGDGRGGPGAARGERREDRAVGGRPLGFEEDAHRGAIRRALGPDEVMAVLDGAAPQGPKSDHGSKKRGEARTNHENQNDR